MYVYFQSDFRIKIFSIQKVSIFSVCVFSVRSSELTENTHIYSINRMFRIQKSSIIEYQFGAGSNNEQRWHSAAQAATADVRSLHAWTAHPQLVLVTNNSDFSNKCATVTRIVAAHGWHGGRELAPTPPPFAIFCPSGRFWEWAHFGPF